MLDQARASEHENGHEAPGAAPAPGVVVSRSRALLAILAAVLATGAAVQKADGLALPTALAGYRGWFPLLEEPRLVSAPLWSLCRPPTVAEKREMRWKGGPHAERRVMVYATPDAAQGLTAKPPSFRPGAILAKEKLGPDGAPEAVAFMIKHGGRAFAASGGWEFRYYPSDPDPGATHRQCAACHRNELSRDFVLGVYPTAGSDPAFVEQVTQAALAQTGQRVRYDGAYRRIPYPGGDVPAEIGVCTDVVVRAYRAAGVDLQQRVHEDMARAFAAYPRVWGLTRPDPNIDHRRVPNLQTYFRRRGAEVRITSDPRDYAAGDLVTWMLPGNLPHIGVVTGKRTADGHRPLIVHNIGNGPELEDMLMRFPITGHYRYRGE